MGKTTARAPRGARSARSCSALHRAPSGSLRPMWVWASKNESPGSSASSGSSQWVTSSWPGSSTSRVYPRARCRTGARATQPRRIGRRTPSCDSSAPSILRLMSAIEARGLERTFSGDVLAVAGVDLDVAEGEIYAFLGPNGAGKTTTVRILTTLLRPTGGNARVAGFDIIADAGKVRAAIGVALQEPPRDLAGGLAAEPRWDHGLPHDSVSGGGRPARQAGGNHRLRPHRRRGHAPPAEGAHRPPPLGDQAHGRCRAAGRAGGGAVRQATSEQEWGRLGGARARRGRDRPGG